MLSSGLVGHQQIVREDQCQPFDLADEIGIGYEACQRILTAELSMYHVATQLVPRNLTDEQKQQHVNICKELHQIASNDATSLFRVITSDESWIYSYDFDIKQQSSQQKSPNSLRLKKARQVKSKVKSALIIFFGIEGIFHKECPGRPNSQYRILL
jgi:hypothetical protein